MNGALPPKPKPQPALRQHPPACLLGGGGGGPPVPFLLHSLSVSQGNESRMSWLCQSLALAPLTAQAPWLPSQPAPMGTSHQPFKHVLDISAYLNHPLLGAPGRMQGLKWEHGSPKLQECLRIMPRMGTKMLTNFHDFLKRRICKRMWKCGQLNLSLDKWETKRTQILPSA